MTIVPCWHQAPLQRLKRQKRSWEEEEDDWCILVNNDLSKLDWIQEHRCSISSVDLLYALLHSDDDDNLLFLAQQYLNHPHYRTIILQHLNNDDDTIWKFRAFVRYHQERQVRRHAKAREWTTILVQTMHLGARGLALGIQGSTILVSSIMEGAGDTIVSLTKQPEGTVSTTTRRDRLVTLVYLDAMRRASDTVFRLTHESWNAMKENVSNVLMMIQNTTTNLPLPLSLTLHVAGGAIGAGALVGDALTQATGTLVTTTANVTAQVLQHKYGKYHEQVFKDTSQITRNVAKTVTTLSGANVVWSVAKTTGKLQLEQSSRRRGSSDLETEESDNFLEAELVVVDSLNEGKVGLLDSEFVKLKIVDDFFLSEDSLNLTDPDNLSETSSEDSFREDVCDIVQRNEL